MARQINYEAKKVKIEDLINKLNNDLLKNEETMKSLTEKKKEIKKKIKAAEAELEVIKKDEIIERIAAQNLSTEKLEELLKNKPESE